MEEKRRRTVLTTFLTEDVFWKFKEACAKERRSMGEQMAWLIEHWLGGKFEDQLRPDANPLGVIEATAKRLRERWTTERPVADVTITKEDPEKPTSERRKSSRRRPRNPGAGR